VSTKSNVIIDPRQARTIFNYTNPKSETFANLTQSAIKAGFEYNYAKNLTAHRPDWLTQNIQDDVKLIQRAERNLKRYIELDLKLKGKGNIDLAKLQVDVSKFVLKNLAKQKYSETEDATPPSVQVNIVNYNGAEGKRPTVDVKATSEGGEAQGTTPDTKESTIYEAQAQGDEAEVHGTEGNAQVA